MNSQQLQHVVEDLRRAMDKTPYDHHTVEKGVLRDILDYMEPKLEEDRQRINLGDTVQVTYPEEDKRIGVVVRESDYPWYQYDLRLPDGEEITVEQSHVEKIHA